MFTTSMFTIRAPRKYVLFKMEKTNNGRLKTNLTQEVRFAFVPQKEGIFTKVNIINSK